MFQLKPFFNGGFYEATLYNFCSAPNCSDGAGPMSNVIVDSAGNLYGTTYYGGNSNACGGGWPGCGVVFELSPVGTGWKENVLHSFCSQSGCADGAVPTSGLIFDRAGNLYGAAGPVFKLSRSGDGWKYQVIYDANGGWGLTMDAAGNIFVTGYPSVTELSPNGSGGWTPRVDLTFTGNPGMVGTLVVNKAGSLYGTTNNGFGTVYKLSPGTNGKWTEKILYSFDPYNGKDGLPAFCGGCARSGREHLRHYRLCVHQQRTVFELVAQGDYYLQEKVLWGFDFWDGAYPFGSLILDSAGNLYGTTVEGGSSIPAGPDGGGLGTVFELNPKSTVPVVFFSSPNPSIYGQPVTFEALVPSPPQTPPPNYPTGRVNFTWDGNSIGSPTARPPW